MRFIKAHLFSLLLILSLNSLAQNCNDAIYNGEGTFYGGIAGSSSGNCSLPVETNDYYHCAINDSQYDNSNACGAFVKVTGPGGSVVLKVVDRCPECLPGDIDMTQEAFSEIANIEDGRVLISWKFVPANYSDSIKINLKEGSSEFWTAIQFRNIEHSIVSMEYQKQDESWQLVNRAIFNFFIEESGIPSPTPLRVTSILGEQLIFENVVLNLNEDYDTGLQFSTPSECNAPLSINDFEHNAISIYPNPTNDLVTLKGDFSAWSLIDGNGKLINKGNTKTIQFQELTNGLYFLKIREQVIKVIKY